MDLSVSYDLTNAKAITTYNNIKDNEKKTENYMNELNKAAENNDSKKLWEACTDFESYFLQVMYKEMKKTVNSKDGVLPKSQAEQIFQDMLDEQTCENVAVSGNGIGLAQMLYKQLSKQSI